VALLRLSSQNNSEGAVVALARHGELLVAGDQSRLGATAYRRLVARFAA
jgi:hypothetical protein